MQQGNEKGGEGMRSLSAPVTNPGYTSLLSIDSTDQPKFVNAAEIAPNSLHAVTARRWSFYASQSKHSYEIRLTLWALSKLRLPSTYTI